MLNFPDGIKVGVNNHEETCSQVKKGQTFTVDDAVNKVGYGLFQIRLTCLAGLGWFADAAEILLLSMMGDFLSCYWKLQRRQLALLTSLVFGGIMIGCPIFGVIADKYGRKKSLSVSLVLLFIFGAVSAASPTYEWLLVLRGLTGVALGGVSQGFTLLAEYCPTNMRGRAGFFLCYFWSFGTIAVILLTWLVMEYLNNWRVLLALTAVPALLVIISLKWYPESPRYFIVSGQHSKATEILQEMAKMNNCDLPPGQLIEMDKKHKRGRLGDLLSKTYRRTTIILWYIWLSTAFTYYGIVLLSPIIIQRGGLFITKEDNVSNISNEKDFRNLSGVVPCVKFSRQNYIDILWTSSAEFPGLVMFTFLVEICSRRMLLGGSFIISSVLILLLLLSVRKTVVLIILFASRGLLASTAQLIFVITSEAFPTTVRALAMGTGSAFSRLGGLTVPFVAQVLIIENPIAAVCVLAGVAILTAFAAIFIPETRGEMLKESITTK